MTETIILYGIWIPGKGWIRGAENKALMFDIQAVAEQTAKRVKQDAKVYYIDQSLVDIEDRLLEAERTDFYKPWFLFDLKRLSKFFIKDKS